MYLRLSVCFVLVAFCNAMAQNANYQKKLVKLNSFLSQKYNTSIKVNDKKIIKYFSNSSAEAKIEDLYNVIKMPRYKYVYLTCKNEKGCVYSYFTKLKHVDFAFRCKTEADMDTVFQLLSDFWFDLTGVESKTNYSNKELFAIQTIDDKVVKLLSVPESELHYDLLSKKIGKNVFALYLTMNIDNETYNGYFRIDNKNYSVQKIKIDLNPLLEESKAKENVESK